MASVAMSSGLYGMNVVLSTSRVTDFTSKEQSIKVGDCVLVQYAGTKQTKKYVVQITEIKENEYYVTHVTH